MSEARRLHVVCYDIGDERRRRSVARLLRDHGERRQRSVFECWLDAPERKRLETLLRTKLTAQDRLLIVPLCGRDLPRTLVQGAAMPEGPPAFYLA